MDDKRLIEMLDQISEEQMNNYNHQIDPEILKQIEAIDLDLCPINNKNVYLDQLNSFNSDLKAQIGTLGNENHLSDDVLEEIEINSYLQV